MTRRNADVNRRRHVVGFIFGSILVGVIGLVTAILMTVTGILNTFNNVSTSYEAVFERGIEVGPTATSLELDDANYTVLTFIDSPQQPSLERQAEACTVTDDNGEAVGIETSTQPISHTELSTTAEETLADANYVIYTSFEATQGTYAVSCQQFGLLSDGGDVTTTATGLGGIVLGISTMVIAAVLFIIGLVNHAHNRKIQRRNPRRVIDYRLEDS